MPLPASLLASLEASLGAISEVTSVSGGDISQAARLKLATGQYRFVKWRIGLPHGIFTAERRGLERLRAAEALQVPDVIAQSEARNGCPAYIVLDWLGPTMAVSTQAAVALGRGLAALHRVTDSEYGLDHDNFIGATPQPNSQEDQWLTFFREQRLGFQAELAAQKGRLPRQRARLLDRLLVRLGEWLPLFPPASLLHGDLWGGNWLITTSGQPALIDPAIYHGHREAELAFTELFGGFPTAFYEAYKEVWPIEQGYSERKDIYNLYHLLNHLNLFGEAYGSQVDAILHRYLG